MLQTCQCSVVCICLVACGLQRSLGLVNGSALGVYNGSHIICSYSRLIDTDFRQAESVYVMNLSTPRYLLLARGPTNEKGKIQYFCCLHLIQGGA